MEEKKRIDTHTHAHAHTYTHKKKKGGGREGGARGGTEEAEKRE